MRNDRSPEAWGFLELFRRHPTIHYPASTCDDLFALGVMAYRLVTDEYPPSTHPRERGAEVWREGASGPRPPRELNPRVSQQLDALVLRLLSVSPEARFGGSAREAAEGLEQAAASLLPSAREPLFDWGHEHRPRVRSPEVVRRAAREDAVTTAGFTPLAPEERVPAQARPAPMRRPAPPPDKFGEVLIRGGCWYLLGGTLPPCKDEAYEWKGACYLPSMRTQRQPTSAPLPSSHR